jgi:ankyrin repeat protein
MQALQKLLSIRADWEDIINLSANGDDVNALNNEGYATLHLAMMNEQDNVIEKLLDYGAYIYVRVEIPRDVKEREFDGWTSLHFAAYNENWEMICFLLGQHGANVNEASNDGMTLLHFDTNNENLEMVCFCLSKMEPMGMRQLMIE